MKLTKDQLLGIIRHSLTFVGGILIMKGMVDESTWAEVVGGAITLVGSVWSITHKKEK
jgi:hypothetical protein